MNKTVVLMLAFVFIYSQSALSAREFPAQLRLYTGKSLINSTVINDYLATQTLDPMKEVGRVGIELGAMANKHIYLGFKYNLGQKTIDGPTSGESVTLTHGFGQIIGRVAFVKADTHYVDFLLGIGGASLALLKKGNTDSMLERTDYSSRIFNAGFSAGIGYKRFFIFTEVGYEKNYVGPMERTQGTLAPIEGVDLSGPYATVGIMIDGIPVSK